MWVCLILGKPLILRLNKSGWFAFAVKKNNKFVGLVYGRSVKEARRSAKDIGGDYVVFGYGIPLSTPFTKQIINKNLRS